MGSPVECALIPGSLMEENRLSSLKNELNAEVNICINIVHFITDREKILFYLLMKSKYKPVSNKLTVKEKEI